MHRFRPALTAFLPWAALVVFCAPGLAQDETAQQAHAFFRGKTITYIVGSKPGGNYDAYGRLVARYLEKHLPGSRVRVKNVPGAGSLIGLNQIGVSKPDGLTVGTFNPGVLYAQILEREGLRVDVSELSWIGKAGRDPRTMVVSTSSGLKSVEDLQRSKEPILFGASGWGASNTNELVLVIEALRLNVKPILGFSGPESRMAILRGEVQGMMGSYSSLRRIVENGDARFVLHFDAEDELPDVPSFASLASGENGERVAQLITAVSSLARPTAGPPGIPPARLEVLRGAYAAALKDSELLAEAKKTLKPIALLGGEELGPRVRQALDQPDGTLSLMRSVLAEKP